MAAQGCWMTPDMRRLVVVGAFAAMNETRVPGLSHVTQVQQRADAGASAWTGDSDAIRGST
jgi:hypothetical protein